MSEVAFRGWRLERRQERSTWTMLSALIAATTSAVLLCSLLFLAAGANPILAFGAIFDGAFGNQRAIAETLARATPLIFTALATAVAFKARLWNIGAEGQVIAGAMFAYFLQIHCGAAPAYVQVPVVLVGALIGGGLLGGFAGFLKVQFRVDEVISTVMLNYIIVFALSMLLQHGPWSEPDTFYEQTPQVSAAARLPLLVARTHLNLGFALALIVAGLMYVLLKRSPLGFEIRAAGLNLRALQIQGTDTRRIMLTILVLSGAIAGLAGASEIYGVQERLKGGVLANLGYTGIIIAILGQLDPRGIVIAAILFGALENGATFMQVMTNVPSALIYAIEAIVLMLFLIARAASEIRIRRSTHAA